MNHYKTIGELWAERCGRTCHTSHKPIAETEVVLPRLAPELRPRVLQPVALMSVKELREEFGRFVPQVNRADSWRRPLTDAEFHKVRGICSMGSSPAWILFEEEGALREAVCFLRAAKYGI